MLENWWIEKSRVNFLAYRMYIHNTNFHHNWFVSDLCYQLHTFYSDLLANRRPILFISTPPQHGKSSGITDFISWISGKISNLRTIYASFSDKLSTRCNLAQQRIIDSSKYKKIFPGTNLANSRDIAVRTLNQLDFIDDKRRATEGQFRNTTINGPITGEGLDLGIIDDAVKGRLEANSKVISDKIWDWFRDDFSTRFSDYAGLIIIMTRWTTHDLMGRLIKHYEKDGTKFKYVNYKAIATSDEAHRKEGEALFPRLKSLSFLMNRKSLMLPQSWESLYQGNPTAEGGNLIKDEWWKWWERLPRLEYTFATADTAQKQNNWNDWTVFQHWGYGTNGNIYLLDMFRERVSAPDLRHKGEAFYLKCNDYHLQNKDSGPFRGMCIEAKSSGIGLIQEFEEKTFKVYSIPRSIDKITRAYDAGPEIMSGKVYINSGVQHVLTLLNESRTFPNGEYDDVFDCTMSAIEVIYIYPEILNDTIFIS